MDITIKVIESVYGNKPAEHMDFLVCKTSNRRINLVAYLRGNGYVKLFSYQDFFQWYVNEDSEVQSTDIEQDLYNTDRPFERFVMQEFFGWKLPKEDLMFGSLGNGITVCDRLREEHRDYMTVAHISYEREVTYYHEVSQEGIERIEQFAKEGDITPTAQPDHHALRPIQ